MNDQSDREMGAGEYSGAQKLTFNHGGTSYTIPLRAAVGSGLIGRADRIELPNGTLVMLHPHIHEDKVNSPESIHKEGGKIWQANH